MKDNAVNLRNAVDITIKIGILLMLLAWCFRIVSPFISIVFWALIIAVSVSPLYQRLHRGMGGHKKTAAALVTVVLLTLILVPGAIFTESMVNGVKVYSKKLNIEHPELPSPDARVKDWPLVGDKLYELWQEAAEHPESMVRSYSKQIGVAASWLFDALMGTGLAVIQFLLSIIISGIFLAVSESGGDLLRRLFRRLMNSKGDEYFQMSLVTVRNVTKGVIGVAFIQSFLAALTFLLAGVPYAGLWGLLCLILCIIQVGPWPVIIPVIVYLFNVTDTWIAALWTIVLILVMLSDNILKPVLMGKGAPVPTLVVFLGSIGGFIVSGFMGLFLGAIVLSLGYKLFIAWVNEGANNGQQLETVS